MAYKPTLSKNNKSQLLSALQFTEHLWHMTYNEFL